MSQRKSIIYIFIKLLLIIIGSYTQICAGEVTEIEHTKQVIQNFFTKDKKSPDIIIKFNKLREYFNFSDPYEGLNFYNELVKNQTSMNSQFKKGLLYNAIASQYTKLRQYEIAAKYYFQSINEAQKSGDSNRVAWNYIDIGNLYYNYNQFNEAINYYKLALPIFDSLTKNNKYNSIIPLDDELGLAVATENIGLCMFGQKKYDSSLYYIRKTEKIRLNPKQPRINKQYYYTTLAATFFYNKLYDSALYYAKLSIDFDPTKELNDIDLPEYHRFRSNAEIIIGQCLLLKNKKEEGYEYFQKSLKTLNYFKSKSPTLNAYSVIVAFLLNHGYTEDANKFLKTGLNIGEKHPDLTYQKYSLLTLAADLYTKLNQLDKAKKIQDTIITYLDSLANRVSAQNIVIAKIDVELQNNLQKIELLNIEREFQEKQLTNQKLITFLLIIIATFLVLLFVIIYYLYLQRQKTNKQLSIKNNELNQLNEKLSKTLKITEEMNVELVKSKEQLARSNVDLEASNQTKNTLFSIIAHDLKNAIGGLRTLNQLLVDDFNKFEINELFELIQLMNNSSNSMYNLLQNLLLWSSSQRGNIIANKELNYPSYIVNKNINLFSQAASNKKLEMINLIPEDFAFVFDATLLDTIFRNLINNAIKFSNEGGKITVSCEPSQNEVLFIVSDTGVGMPKEKIENIFSINRNKSTTGTKGEKGTGLGLMVCYDFVKMHNGRIWFESEVGKGTKAYFTFEYMKPEKVSETLD